MPWTRTSEVSPPRGLLQGAVSDGRLHHARFAPSPSLAFYVAHYWTVSWDLDGHPPQISETLPHPSIHIVLERGRRAIPRLIAGRFTRRLSGRGRVFAIKFRPGAFQPFMRAPVAQLSRGALPMRAVFGQPGEAFRRAILGETDIQRCIRLAETFLAERLPAPDQNVARVRDLVERMAADRTITRVEHAARLLQTDVRGVQRLFRKYVGLSPKWVIQRYRLHEAAELLAQDPSRDLSQLALDLGYFDQAHFARDFKSMVGRPPGQYARAAR